jgi:hypothetical protein
LAAARAAPAAAAWQVLTWILVIGIPVFLVVAFSGASLGDSAQLHSGLSGIVAAHVFEHALDYVFVFLLAMGVAAGARRRAS